MCDDSGELTPASAAGTRRTVRGQHQSSARRCAVYRCSCLQVDVVSFSYYKLQWAVDRRAIACDQLLHVTYSASCPPEGGGGGRVVNAPIITAY